MEMHGTVFIYKLVVVRGKSRNLRKGGPVSFVPFLFSRFPLPLLFSSPLEVGPLKPGRGSGERCNSPSGVRGKALAENEFGAL